jgi:hypothetical protein
MSSEARAAGQDWTMPTASSPVASQTKLLGIYRQLAHVLPLLVLIQAWMAGHSDTLGFGDFGITIHGIVGNVSYLLAVAALVITLVARANKGAVVVAAALVVLMTIQIGLGYSGRDSNGAAAWHIPNGVAIFGLAVYQVSVATALVKGTRRADLAS